MLAFMVILWYISTTRYTLELGLTALNVAVLTDAHWRELVRK